MGSSHLLSPTTVYYLSSNPTKTLKNPKFSSEFRCALSSRSNWDPNPNAFRTGRFRFEDDIGFGGREKRRNWWSDDDDDDDEEDDDDDVDEFGFWEVPNAIDWIFKVFRAFGWMVPAILISTLLGTGPNSLIMALVLPLGQTALSIAMDKLWGGPSSNPNPRSRPRPRARSRSRPRPERNPFDGIANKEARESRTVKRSGPAKSGSRFGGWDELDEVVSNTNFSREEQNRDVDEVSRQQSRTGKLSRRRNREKPLLMRLLIAVFPFLGSWTTFLL